MLNKLCCCFLFICACFSALAQDTTTDTARVLANVTVNAFEQNKQLKEVSAAINLINKSQLDRFGNTSLVPAVNSTPGVRMEERSPGSYRLNVRGSTLRSPFGVRNVKVYWNDIPFTDPGGNTYLNQLSFFNVQSIEVIKGPAGSIYGAGTGGALLLQSQPVQFQPGIVAGYTGGSYNTHAFNAQVNAGTEERRNSFTFSHQLSDGYRYHTNMRRDIGTWETQLKVSDKQQINTSFLYGDLYYQTPGALTLKEYTANPRAYRPVAGGLPDAEQAQAAINQKMVLAGITNHYHFSSAFHNTTTVYGGFVQFTNPTFRTYEKRSEPQFGGRTVFNFTHNIGKASIDWVAGAEMQKGFFNTKDYRNLGGKPDTLQTDDDINSWIYEVFLQTDVKLPGNWDITAGASFNRFHISDQRLSDPSLSVQQRTYSNEIAPRFAISKKIISNAWIYASVAKGFSPPAIAEVLPPSRTISTSLNAERGINYELGVKSNWLNNRLYVEINAFYFRLQDAIVQRQELNAANYYVNAGNTKQKGLESQLAYQLLSGNSHVFRQAKVWINHTWNDFRYDSFKQLAADYSGKQMPSVAKNTVAAGLDILLKAGFYANVTYYYSDPIAMNDANTDFATSYNLLGARIGYRKSFSHIAVNVFTGADNLFDVTYSLGNDINAAGGRYYNAAAGRNYYAGLSFEWKKK
ncbi:MAG: TonB-dependent receptor plug domain-containing protein [Chitinophagaceae bacterium]